MPSTESSSYPRLFLAQIVIAVSLVFIVPVVSAWGADSAHAPRDQIYSQITHGWNNIITALEKGDFRSVNELVDELVSLRLRAGFDSFTAYSFALLKRAAEYEAQGKDDEAAYLAQKALQLSPFAPEVMLRAVPLSGVMGDRSAPMLIVDALLRLPHAPYLLITLLLELTYPALWSITLALYCVFVIAFLKHFRTLLNQLALRLPTFLRPLTPALLLFLLLAPVSSAPLTCLGLWAVLAALYLPKMRIPVLLSGLTLALWASAIPLHQNARSWFESEAVQSMLASVTSDFEPVKGSRYSEIIGERILDLAQSRPDDPLPWYAWGQFLRREGRLDEARRAFDRVLLLRGKDYAALAERGLVELASGNSAEAQKYYSEAQLHGARNASFLYNFSRIRFEQGDTEASRQLFMAAYRKDSRLVDDLKERESAPGIEVGRSVAPILPSHTLIEDSALYPIIDVRGDDEKLAQALFPGFGVLGLGAAGLLLCFVGTLLIFTSRESQPARANYYPQFGLPRWISSFLALIPGGTAVSDGHRLASAALLALCLFVTLPLLGWPKSELMYELLRGHRTILLPLIFGIGGLLELFIRAKAR